jgi:hypothetical protein
VERSLLVIPTEAEGSLDKLEMTMVGARDDNEGKII